MHSCPNCGKPVKNGVAFCPHCGTKQDVAKPVNSNDHKSSVKSVKALKFHRPSGKKWIWLVVIVVLVIGGFMFYKHHEDSQLSYVLPKHSWVMKPISTKTGKVDKSNDNNKYTFKNNKMYLDKGKQKHEIGTYSVPSNNRLKIHMTREHVWIYENVKSVSLNKVSTGREYARLEKTAATQLKYYAKAQHEHIPAKYDKIFNGQKYPTHERLNFVK